MTEPQELSSRITDHLLCSFSEVTELGGTLKGMRFIDLFEQRDSRKMLETLWRERNATAFAVFEFCRAIDGV